MALSLALANMVFERKTLAFVREIAAKTGFQEWSLKALKVAALYPVNTFLISFCLPSFQCPCQPSVSSSSALMNRPAASAISTITGSMPDDSAAPPLSAYYPQPTQTPYLQPRVPRHNPAPPLDLERFRRPVESPALSESRSSLASSQQQQPQQHQQQFGAHSQQQQLNTQGLHPNGYQDLEETSSEASSTRIASRMSGDPNVTTSTENDTRQLTNGCNPANNPPPPYSPYCAAPATTTVIHHTIPPNKKDSYLTQGIPFDICIHCSNLYSKLPSSVSSRQTLIRAVMCSSVLIAMLTALCVVLLVVSGGRAEGGASALISDGIFGDAIASGIGSGALSVVPAPTDLVDRSQVIIVNRRNPTQSAEQAAQLSDLLALVGAYNATARDAAFPSQLIQTVQPGCTAEEQFGYRRGEPCVAVVLRPDPAFIPVPLASSDDAEGIDNGGSNLLELECLCENRRNVQVAYSPFRGFPLRFFPRSARASPLLVMLRFEDLPLKTELRISCGLRGAHNVDPRNDRVNFQIMVI
ncbi:hypothetical protein BIW11_11225 [Tropilaelaps mercedesae]|uniref:Uncharacterized protein n=1 Tax=Tropilaelaps mercedesae TaxID=418985 RepID=A0A1V9XC25_9ACAR|nr:hypothetical protein BIW11_11225 [Tropilaelaps mercedesae]